MNKEQLKAKLASLDPAQRQALLAKLQQKDSSPQPAAAVEVLPSASGTPTQVSLAVSNAQTRMWLFEKINGSGAAYNIVSALQLIPAPGAQLDPSGIEWAFNQVIRRHEILRSALVEQHGVLKTEILPELVLQLQQSAVDWRLPQQQAELTALILQWAAQPIDLSQAPLLRLRALLLADGSLVLVLLMHHIIADGWSLRVLEQELSQFYQQWLQGQHQPAATLPVQYKHYVAWERDWLTQEQAGSQLAYWRQQLAKAPAVLRLPELLNQPAASAALHADSYVLTLPPALCQQVERVATERQLSSFMLYLAAFKLVLSHYSADEDLVVGTPVAARRQRWQQDMIGLLSNSVALRSVARRQLSLSDYLQQIRRVSLAAFDHQELPFEKIVDAVQPVRQQDLPPLFQVLFALQSSTDSALDLAGLQIKPLALPRHAAEFPLVAELFLTSGGGYLNWSYQQARFETAQITALAEHFMHMLQLLLTQPELTIAQACLQLTALETSVAAAPATVAATAATAADWLRQQLTTVQQPALASEQVTESPSELFWLDPALPASVQQQLRRLCDGLWAETAEAAQSHYCFVLTAQAVAGPRQVLVNPAPQSDGSALWLPLAPAATQSVEPVLLWRPATQAALYSNLPLRLVNAEQQELPVGLLGELQVMVAGQWLPTAIQAVRELSGYRPCRLLQTQPLGWCQGQVVDLQLLSQQLQQLDAVAEAVVLVRTDVQQQQRLLAYLVPARPLTLTGVQSRCEQLLVGLGYESLPLTVSVVSELPRDDAGRLRQSLLFAQPVLDQALMTALSKEAPDWTIEPTPFVLPQLTLLPAAQPLPKTGQLDDNEQAGRPVTQVAAPSILQSAPLSYGEQWVADLLSQAASRPQPAGIHCLWSQRDDAAGFIADASYLDYAMLYRQARQLAAGLQQLGIVPGDVIALQLYEVQEILLAFWSAVLAGAVLLDIEMPASYLDPADKDVLRLQHALASLPVKLAIVPAAAPAGASQFLLEQHGVGLTDLTSLAGTTQPYQQVQRQRDDALLLMLTSGSTGKPKIVVQTHGAVCYHAHSFAAAARLTEQSVSFNWMPLQHVGGIVMCHTVPMLCNAVQIHAPTAAIVSRPLDLLACLSHYRATMCWCPNFAFSLLNEAIRDVELTSQGWDLSAMQVLLNGGEAVVQKTVQQLVTALAEIGLSEQAVHPTWGMSETCSATLLNSSYQPFAVADSNYVSVGTAIPGLQFRVVDAEEQVLPQGRSGRLQVRGPTVTTGYYQNPQANQTAFNAEGWFNTGDLAVINDAELAIVGREKDLIIINGMNYHGLDIELCVENLPGILKAHTAACAVRRAQDDTDKLCLFYATTAAAVNQPQLQQQIRQLTAKQLGVVPTYLIPLPAEAFPRTSIGKIQRSELAQAFMRGDFDHLDSNAGSPVETVVPAFFHRPYWRREQPLCRPDAGRQVLLLLNAQQWAVRHQLASGWIAVTAETLAAALTQLPANAAVQLVDCRFYQSQLLTAAVLSAEQGLAALWQSAALLLQQLDCSFDYVLLTANSYQLHGDIPQISQPASVALAAALQALQAEHHQLRGRHICLSAAIEAALLPDQSQQQLLARELAQPAGQTVLLVAEQRFVQRLSAVFALPQKIALPAPVPELQVVIGGLGGIGSLLSLQLLRQGHALLVIGRRSLEQLQQDPSLQSFWQTLTPYAARWCYQQADATDAVGLQQALQQGSSQLQLTPSRVFYLAGQAGPAALAEQTPATVAAVLAPKVTGLHALQQALEDWPAVEQVHFCSTTALLGGRHYHAYSAANAYQWAFCQSLQAQGKAVRCLLWSMWRQLGMSAGAEDAAVAAAGYQLLDAELGWQALQVALHLPEWEPVLIGLDPAALSMQPLAVRACESLFRPGLAAAAALAAAPKTDSFGTALYYLLAERSGDSVQALLRDPRYLQLKAVWSDVLQQSELTPDANFFALGGDSILAIQCAARAAANGIFFQPRDLFEQQTLAALLHVVSGQQLQGEQEQISGDVPLLPMQHWFFAQNFDRPAQMNQSVLLSCTDALQPERLVHCLQQLLQYHDGLRAGFRLEQGLWRQDYAATVSLQLQHIRLPVLSAAEFAETLQRHCDELQASLQLDEAPLLKAIWFDAAKPGQRRLFLAVHHLIIDGVSWRILVEALNSLYSQADGQTAAEVLGGKSHSVRQWHHAVQQYLQSPQAAEQANYWQQMVPTECPVLQPDLAGSNHRADETQQEVEFDAELTDVLFRQLPAAHGLKADDLLLTALAVAFERWTGASTFGVLIEGHGRELPDGMETLDLTRTLGWFTAMYPLYLTDLGHNTLAQRVLQTHRQLAQMPDGGVSYQWLKYLGSVRQQAQLAAALPQISYNYLGRFDGAADALFSFAAESCGRQIAAEQHRPNELDIVGRILAGKAAFAFIYSGRRYSAAHIATFVTHFRAVLTELAAVSPSDWAFARQQPALVCNHMVPVAVVAELSAQQPELAAQVSHLLPVTPVQLGVLFETLLSGEGLYVSQLSNDLRGELDVQALQAAWQDVVDAHSIYRTGFVLTASGLYLQRIERRVTLPFWQDDWRHYSAVEQEAAFARLLQADREQGFVLSAPPLLRITLLRLADRHYRMLISEHHTVSDGWSRSLVLAQVAERYRYHHSAVGDSHLPAMAQYHDYLDWLQRFDRHSAEAYWQTVPLQHQQVALLAGQQPGRQLSADSAGYQHLLSVELSSQLQQTARQAQVTVNAVAQAGWALLLHLYTGSQTPLFATTHAGRPPRLAGVEAIVGPLINTLPVLAQLDSAVSVQQFLQQIQQQLLQLSEFGYLSLADIGALQHRRDLSELMQTLFVFENFPLTAPAADAADTLRIDAVRSIDSTEYPLMISVIPGAAIKFQLYYLSAQFTAEAVAQLCLDYAQILGQLGEVLSAPLLQQSWLPDDRMAVLLQQRTRLPQIAVAQHDEQGIEVFEF